MRSRGFTLIEVLVALAIVAVALASAGRALGVVTDGAAEAKLRLLAGFVAENRLGELAAQRAWPAPGLYEGVEHQGGVAFAWRVQVSSTPHPLFRRVEVRVAHPATPSHELRRLVGVLPKEG